jgi:hypothetical protein
MTRLRKMMLEELQGRKITVLVLLVVLGLVEDSMVRSDSRVFGVAGIIFQVHNCFDRLVTAGPRQSACWIAQHSSEEVG